MPQRFHALITDFCFGETTPRVASRLQGGNIFGVSPADVYRSGCREITNMLVVPQGGAYRREGFKFGRDTIDDVPAGIANGDTYRLFDLTGELGDSVLLFVPGEVWLYQLPSFTVVGHAATPYTSSDLLDIGVAQWEKKVVVYSAGHRPRQILLGETFALTDPGTTTFRAPVYAFQDAAAPPPQVSKWRLRLSFKAYTGTYVVITVGGFSTVSGMKGKPLWSLVSTNTSTTQANILFNLQANEGTFAEVVTYIGTGTAAGYTWFDYDIEYQFYSKLVGDGVLVFTVQGEGATPDSLASIAPLVQLASQQEPLWSGPLLLLKSGTYYECVAPHTAAAINEPGIGANWTTYWISRGTTLPTDRDYDVITETWAIANTYSRRDRGWPGHMIFHEQRLAGSGPSAALSVIAAAKISGGNDMFDFTLGPNDSDGMLFRLASALSASVRWFYSSDKLYIGTSSGVYVQAASPWTPTNVDFPRINGYASAVHIHAVEVEGELFFVTGSGRQLRQVSFSNELQSWQSFDLTAFAEHMFTKRKRFKQITAHQGVDTLMWTVRTDGALLGLTYSPAYHTLAWHKHGLSDPVIEVAPAFDGTNYVTVALVARRVFKNGAWETHPCLEMLEHTSQNLFDVEPSVFDESAPEARVDWQTSVLSPAEWSVHLDSYEKLTSAGTSNGQSISVPLRFANRPIGFVEDGVYLGSFTPDPSGAVVVDTVPNGALFCGFEFASRVQPNRFESQMAMTSQSAKVRWVKPVMRLLTSAMPKLNGVRPSERVQDDTYNTATALFSGDVYVASTGSDGKLVIEADLPLPCHVTGIFGLMTAEEG